MQADRQPLPDRPLLTERPGLLAQPQAAELTAEKVVVRFGGLAAISDVTLTVQRHEVFGLIGPNGAGKTTLVNCLTGFQRPTSGSITLGRAPTAGWSPDKFRKQGVGRTFQAGRLFRDMTVLENVEVTAVGLGLGRRAAAERAMAMLEWVGLAAQASLAEWVATIPRRFDCGVLLIEHNMRVIMGVCDRIHVLDGGRTLAEGTAAEIQDNPAVIAAYLGMEP